MFSLLASKDGMIATEVTDTHASTLMAETSGSVGASGGVLRADAGAKAQASDTRTTQVLGKAIVQSTFRDLYQGVRDTLVIAPAPAMIGRRSSDRTTIRGPTGHAPGSSILRTSGVAS